MKKLDLEEFYQEENAYYKKAQEENTGLHATILITPKQTVAVYNNKALDCNGTYVAGLESHESTSLDIIANLFHQTLKGDTDQKIFTINHDILKGVDLNYVVIRLTNSQVKTAHAEIPVIINQYQADQLKQIAKHLTALNVSQQALIHPFNPELCSYHPNLSEQRFLEDGLNAALNYQKTNQRIKKDLHIKNAYYPEYTFSAYDQEKINSLKH